MLHGSLPNSCQKRDSRCVREVASETLFKREGNSVLELYYLRSYMYIINLT